LLRVRCCSQLRPDMPDLAPSPGGGTARNGRVGFVRGVRPSLPRAEDSMNATPLVLQRAAPPGCIRLWIGWFPAPATPPELEFRVNGAPAANVRVLLPFSVTTERRKSAVAL